MKKIFTSAALALALFMLAACNAPSTQSLSASTKTDASPTESGQAKSNANPLDFELEDLDGKTVQISDFNGQNVYIKYWASWCPICLEGLESLNNLAGEENDFVILTIVAPSYKGELASQDFKEWFAGVENTENLRVLLDENGNYMQQVGVRGYPTSQWVGPDGTALNIQPGAVDNAGILAGFANTAEEEGAT